MCKTLDVFNVLKQNGNKHIYLYCGPYGCLYVRVFSMQAIDNVKSLIDSIHEFIFLSGFVFGPNTKSYKIDATFSIRFFKPIFSVCVNKFCKPYLLNICNMVLLNDIYLTSIFIS